MHDLAAIASSRVHVDSNANGANTSSSDAQATIRQFQAADPDRFNQLLKSIPGAISQVSCSLSLSLELHAARKNERTKSIQ